MTDMPEIPDEDHDFTPDLARKIIGLYQTRIRALEAGLTKAKAALHIATNDKLSLLEQLDTERQGRMAQIDYSCDLQRIIEDLCRGGPVREPKTSARRHYDMATAFLSALEATPAPQLAEAVCDATGCAGPALEATPPAREVMARAQADYWDSPDIPEAYWPMVDAQLAALTAAGFRIVGPEEVDPVTVEKCAAIADEHTKAGCTTPDGSQTSAMRLGAASIAAMIRVLKGENQ